MPTVAALALFGFFAHEVARRALEDELGRRLGTAAAGAAATLLPEQLRALGPGDEDSLNYANVRRRLEAARMRLGVRRVLAVTPGPGVARRHVGGARARRARLRAGRRPRRDRARGARDADRVAAVRRARRRPLQARLRGRRRGGRHRRLHRGRRQRRLPGGAGGLPALDAAGRRLAALAAVLLLTVWLSRRISRPVARLAQAAARLGRGDLDAPHPDRDARRDRRAGADAGGDARRRCGRATSACR